MKTAWHAHLLHLAVLAVDHDACLHGVQAPVHAGLHAHARVELQPKLRLSS